MGENWNLIDGVVPFWKYEACPWPHAHGHICPWPHAPLGVMATCPWPLLGPMGRQSPCRPLTIWAPRSQGNWNVVCLKALPPEGDPKHNNIIAAPRWFGSRLGPPCPLPLTPYPSPPTRPPEPQASTSKTSNTQAPTLALQLEGALLMCMWACPRQSWAAKNS